MRYAGLVFLFLLSAGGVSHAGSPATAEPQRLFTTAGGSVRVIVNTPGAFDPARSTQLIIYTCPNGNTAEQTLGAKLEPGMDWHFDIQHVAAQVRKLRQLDPSRNIVLACLEAEGKSWPSWRKARADNGKIIRGIVDELIRAVEGSQHRITLVAHSGGGSFIFGYINGDDAIADNVDRIAFLDANYAFDEQEHGQKLLAWLKGDAARHLINIAYDDSRITLGGKPVLKSPMGGTFGSTRRMVDWLGKHAPLEEGTRGSFQTWTAMQGQVRFLVHANAENKILHTVLVERNGVIEAMTLGTPHESKWGGEFWGARAYAELIAAAPPSTRPTAAAATMPATQASQASGIPDRPANARGGKSFAESIADLPPKAREAAIVQEVLRGNIPPFLRKLVTVKSDGCEYQAMPDYLAVGSDDDFVRLPMMPQSAQQIADAFGYALPTRKMVDQVYAQAQVKLEPRPMTEKREEVETFVDHNAIIERQRTGKPLGRLVAGHKKDVVITNRLKEKPDRVAIYGWHKLDGKPIQPLYVGHVDWYVDYSHGVRLVKREMSIDGKTVDLVAVLRDAQRCDAVSDEGPIEAGYR